MERWISPKNQSSLLFKKEQIEDYVLTKFDDETIGSRVKDENTYVHIVHINIYLLWNFHNPFFKSITLFMLFKTEKFLIVPPYISSASSTIMYLLAWDIVTITTNNQSPYFGCLLLRKSVVYLHNPISLRSSVDLDINLA